MCVSVSVTTSLLLLAHFFSVDAIEYKAAGKETVLTDHIIRFPDLDITKTRRETPVREIRDNHTYYTSTFLPPGSAADDLWFDLSNVNAVEAETNASESDLQDLFRYYELWTLKFNFPFYGHTINTVAVTTGGFLYTGELLHDQIHLTQFIAPLQANFNPSLNDTARILVYNAESRFTVQWDKVHNHDHVEDGPFTFQVSLFPNGTIYFVYREIPLNLNEIDNDDHPVEVGLADAFYIFGTDGQLTIVYIYEYSRIQLNSTQNLTNSAYVITPITNCVIARSCESCTDITEQGNFQCSWCPSINRCSDGIDRFRQLWLIGNCNNIAVNTCVNPYSTTTTYSTTTSIVITSSYINVKASSTHIVSSSSPTIITSKVPISSSATPTITSNPPPTTIGRFSTTAAAITAIVVILIAIILVVLAAVAVLFIIYKKGLVKRTMPINTTANYKVEDEKAILDEDFES